MREDREAGRWLAYRIGMLVQWHRDEAFAGKPTPTGLDPSGRGFICGQVRQITGAVAAIDGRLVTSAYHVARPGCCSRQPNCGWRRSR